MWHLLVWVVGSASASRLTVRSPRLALCWGPRGRAFVAGYTPAMGMAFGTILTGCGLLAYRRWQGDTFYPSRAGHWLLLFGLAAAAADVAAVVAYAISPQILTFHPRS